MNLRNSLCFRLIAAVLAPSMIFVGLPSAAKAQVVAPGNPLEAIDRPSAVTVPPAVPMSVAVPSDTEVLQAERPVINPVGVPTLPLEEPLDPDKYICGRGDVFELNFWGGLNFDLTLVEPRTFLVHVVEDVPHPGLYTARPVERASNVLARAGGIPANGSKRRISIRHREGTTATVDLLLYNLTGDTKLNPYLMDGDLIRVP